MIRNGLRRRLARVENDAGRAEPQLPVAGHAAAADDVGVLASEITAAFGELIDGYREYLKLRRKRPRRRPTSRTRTAPSG
jgi:hypothetical protein